MGKSLSQSVNQLRKDKWAMLRAVLGEFRPSDRSAVSERTASLVDELACSLAKEGV